MAVAFEQTFCTRPRKAKETPAPTFTWQVNIKPELDRDTLYLDSPTFYTDFGDFQMQLDTRPVDGKRCPECGETRHHNVWIWETRMNNLIEDKSGLKRFSFVVKKGTEGVAVSACKHALVQFYHEFFGVSRMRDSSRLEIVVTVELPPVDFERRLLFPAVNIHRDLTEYFSELWWSGKRSDVSFRVEGQIIRAHREIIAASSSVFRKMFRGRQTSPDRRLLFDIENCQANAFQVLLRSIYTGQIDNIHRWALPLMILAARYEVESVRRTCFMFINAAKDSANTEKVVAMFQMEEEKARAKMLEENVEEQRKQMAKTKPVSVGKDSPSMPEENMKNVRLGTEGSASTSLASQYIMQLENPGALPGAPNEPALVYGLPVSRTFLPAAGPAAPSRESPTSKIDARLDVKPSGSGRPSPPPTYSLSMKIEVGQTAVASTSGSTSSTTVAAAAAPPLPPTLPESPAAAAAAAARPQPRPARPAVPTHDLLPASRTYLKNWLEIQKDTAGTEGSRASSASRLSTASVASRPSTPTSLPSANSNRDSNKTADSAASVGLPPPIPSAQLTYLKLDVSALLANRKSPAETRCSVDSLEKSPEPEAQSIDEMRQDMNKYLTKVRDKEESSSVPDVKGASFAERVKSVSQARRPEGLEQRLLSTAAVDVAPVNTLPVVEDSTNDVAAADVAPVNTLPVVEDSTNDAAAADVAPVNTLPVVEDSTNDAAAARAAATATATSSTGTTKKKGKGKKKKKKGKKNNKPASSDAKTSLDDAKDGEKKTTDNSEDVAASLQKMHNEYMLSKQHLWESMKDCLEEQLIKERNSQEATEKKMVIYFDADFQAKLKEANAVSKAIMAESEKAHETNDPGRCTEVLNYLLSKILDTHPDQNSENEEKSNEKEDSPEADDSKVTEAPENEEKFNETEDSPEADDSKLTEAPENEEKFNETEDCDKKDDRGIEEARTSFIEFEETEASEKTYNIEVSDTTDNASEVNISVQGFFKDYEKSETSDNKEKSNETKKSHESSTSSTLPKEVEDPEDEEKTNEKEDCDKTEDCRIDEARTSFQDSEETKDSDNIEVSDTTEDASEMYSVVRGTLSFKISEKSEISENEEKSKETKQSHKSNDFNGAENSTSSTVSKEAEAPEDEEKANEKEDSDESDDCKLELEDSLDSSRTVSVAEESIKTLEEIDNIDIDNTTKGDVEIRDFSECSVSFKVSKKSEASNKADEQVEKSDDVKISEKSEDSDSADDSLESKNFEETNGSISKENSKETEASDEIKDAAEYEDSNEVEELVPAENPREIKIPNEAEDSNEIQDAAENEDSNEFEEPVPAEEPREIETPNEAENEENSDANGENIDDSYKHDLFYKYVEKWDSR